MSASPIHDNIAKIPLGQSAREAELVAALDNIERLTCRYTDIDKLLLRGRLERVWLIARQALL